MPVCRRDAKGFPLPGQGGVIPFFDFQESEVVGINGVLCDTIISELCNQ